TSSLWLGLPICQRTIFVNSKVHKPHRGGKDLDAAASNQIQAFYQKIAFDCNQTATAPELSLWSCCKFPAMTYSRPRRTTIGPGCLTAVFGMGTGGTIQVCSPRKFRVFSFQFSVFRRNHHLFRRNTEN